MNDTAGLLVDGFDRPPSILMPYQPPYYKAHLDALGYARAMTMWAYFIHDAYLDDSRLRRGVGIVRRRHPDLTVRPLDMKRFDEDVSVALRLYNEAWGENWGNVAYTDAEAVHLAKELKPVLEPELFLFLEKAGEPIAFAVSLPNLNRALKHIDNGRLLPFGLPKLLAMAKSGPHLRDPHGAHGRRLGPPGAGLRRAARAGQHRPRPGDGLRRLRDELGAGREQGAHQRARQNGRRPRQGILHGREDLSTPTACRRRPDWRPLPYRY